MAAGLRAYRQVLADPRARGFAFAGLMARLPLSMTGIGIVLLVSLTTGSFGRAGLITAAGTITGALVAPLWGRAIDRVGQARVLITAVIINTVSLAIVDHLRTGRLAVAGEPARLGGGRGGFQFLRVRRFALGGVIGSRDHRC